MQKGTAYLWTGLEVEGIGPISEGMNLWVRVPFVLCVSLSVFSMFMGGLSWAQTYDSATALQLMNAQQNYFLQQQQAAALAAQNAANAQVAGLQTAQQNQSLFRALGGICVGLLSSRGGSRANTQTRASTLPAVDESQNAADQIILRLHRERTRQAPSFGERIDREVSARVGTQATTTFAAGCSQFIDREGRLGALGHTALDIIRDDVNRSSFSQNAPPDILQLCPGYRDMDEGQRDLYWVWILASMASAESSCNPNVAPVRARNGEAIGLFQLERTSCGSRNDELREPALNIRCAVNMLATELRGRATLTSATSTGRVSQGATYWGVLRNDDYNLARGHDIQGGQRARAMMSQYAYCNSRSGEAPAVNAPANPGAVTAPGRPAGRGGRRTPAAPAAPPQTTPRQEPPRELNPDGTPVAPGNLSI